MKIFLFAESIRTLSIAALLNRLCFAVLNLLKLSLFPLITIFFALFKRVRTGFKTRSSNIVTASMPITRVSHLDSLTPFEMIHPRTRNRLNGNITHLINGNRTQQVENHYDTQPAERKTWQTFILPDVMLQTGDEDPAVSRQELFRA